MEHFSRRDFVARSLGLTTVSASGLILLGDTLPTEASGTLGNYARYVEDEEEVCGGRNGPATGPVPEPNLGAPTQWRVTEPNILGPYHRAGAPFRAKITPPLEPGTVLLISGRVWGLDSRRPLANAIIDIWQANAQGRYDNDDPNNPPVANVFKNRARLLADENGYYEYETIHPGPYQIGPNAWRPSHIHYFVRHPGYRQLVTQLYFRGDRHNNTDQFIRPSLIIDLREQRGPNNQTYRTGVFNIILERQG